MGLLMAAPVGAVGVMCVKRAMSGEWARAMAVGLGSATVDAIFGAIAGLGLTLIATIVMSYQTELGLAGGLIITGLGAATYFSQPKDATPGLEFQQLWRDLAKAFTLSIANPATFLGALGLFAALGPASTRQSVWMLVTGVFSGSILWWSFLSAVTRLFRHRFGIESLQRLNKIEGIVIGVVGLVVVAVAAINALR